jgi:hypothetical protein
MTVAAAQVLIQVMTFYLCCGAVFAVIFLWQWVGELDAAAAHGTWGFRLMVFPGVVAFWPLFAARLIRR